MNFMLGIHKFCDNDATRPQLGYIQIKDGYAWATNQYIVIKAPVEEVFGKGVFTSEEEFYVSSERWQREKFGKAKTITRDGDVLTASSAKGTLGTITLISAGKFAEDVGKFPPVNVVLPDPGNYTHRFGFDVKLLSAISDCFGESRLKMMPDNDKPNICNITPLGSDTKAQVVCLGLVVEPDCYDTLKQTPDHYRTDALQKEVARLRAENLSRADDSDPKAALDEAERRFKNLQDAYDDINDERDDLLTKIEKLETKIDNLEDELNEKDDILEKLSEYQGRYYRAENLLEEQLHEAFFEALKEVNPHQLLTTLNNLKELV